MSFRDLNLTLEKDITYFRSLLTNFEVKNILRSSWDNGEWGDFYLLIAIFLLHKI